MIGGYGFQLPLSDRVLLDEMGFKFGTYLWNPQYKGLDDYIYASKS